MARWVLLVLILLFAIDALFRQIFPECVCVITLMTTSLSVTHVSLSES